MHDFVCESQVVVSPQEWVSEKGGKQRLILISLAKKSTNNYRGKRKPSCMIFSPFSIAISRRYATRCLMRKKYLMMWRVVYMRTQRCTLIEYSWQGQFSELHFAVAKGNFSWYAIQRVCGVRIIPYPLFWTYTVYCTLTSSVACSARFSRAIRFSVLVGSSFFRWCQVHLSLRSRWRLFPPKQTEQPETSFGKQGSMPTMPEK